MREGGRGGATTDGALASALVARVSDLEAQRAFVLTILDTLADPVFVKDEQHHWILLNQAFCDFMGHEREVLLGKSDYEFFPKQEADVFWRVDNQVFETGETNENEETFTDGAGVEHVIATKKSLCRDASGNKVLVGVIRDITARVRAEGELRRAHEDLERRVRARTTDLERANADLSQSEERFRVTFEQAAVGIVHTASDGTFLRVNQRLCDMLGYTQAEMRGHSFRDFTHPDDIDESERVLRDAFAGRAPISIEKRYRRKDGGEVWTNVTTNLAHDAEGRPTHLITVVQDISKRKAAERALAASEAQLRQAQKMEAVGRLAGGVAHDFNNLLLVITMNCELARRSAPEDEQLAPLLDEAINAARRAAGLTRQLLTFTRQQVVQSRVMDVNEVVEEMASMARRLIGEDVTLQTSIASGAWLVRADPDQLMQVLMNLVVNARDAMPDGGRVTIETSNVAIAEGTGTESLAAGEYLLLRVRDTGCGMDAATQTRLFEPFFTTKPEGKGTGLGLSTVYGIVKQCGGVIVVESSIGRGSTFSIYLPRAAPAPQAKASPAGEPVVAHGSETVLLVDDEPMVRSAVGELLRRNGYLVLVAGTPDEAIAIAGRHRAAIHLLVTDVVMPGMNGRALAERVREMHSETAVVYMSGYAPAAILHHGVLDGSTAFVQKPFNEQQFLRVLREALHRTAA